MKDTTLCCDVERHIIIVLGYYCDAPRQVLSVGKVFRLISIGAAELLCRDLWDCHTPGG